MSWLLSYLNPWSYLDQSGDTTDTDTVLTVEDVPTQDVIVEPTPDNQLENRTNSNDQPSKRSKRRRRGYKYKHRRKGNDKSRVKLDKSTKLIVYRDPRRVRVNQPSSRNSHRN